MNRMSLDILLYLSVTISFGIDDPIKALFRRSNIVSLSFAIKNLFYTKNIAQNWLIINSLNIILIVVWNKKNFAYFCIKIIVYAYKVRKKRTDSKLQ